MLSFLPLSFLALSFLLERSTGLVISRRTISRVKPLNENFGLDIAESPEENTLREIYGEVNYKNFVGKYEPNGLLLGGYDIIQRVRELKILSLTAESGLLEALEEKGITLSQLEKVLPLADDLGLLPLLVKNKGLVLSAAPLLIEFAPSVIPLAVSLLKTSPSTFLVPGVALLGAGVFESTDNLFLGVPLVLLGLPLAVLGSVLGASISLPDPSTYSSASDVSSISFSKPSVSFSSPVEKKSLSLPNLSAAPRVKASASAASSGPKKPRKLIKINKY